MWRYTWQVFFLNAPFCGQNDAFKAQNDPFLKLFRYDYSLLAWPDPKGSEARSLFAWLAVEEVGHPAAEVARFLGISLMGGHKAVTRRFELKRIHVSLG
jgi:hypothetical protein